jgi:hypothetical protein
MKSLSVGIGIVLIIGLTILGCTITFAFDVDGFKSGMTKKEVKEMLKGWNFDKIDEEEDSVRAYDTTKTAKRWFSFGFRNNKLTSFQKDFPPTMKNFIYLFNKFTLIYGKPIDSYSDISLDSSGETRSIWFWWKINSEIQQLSYNVFPNNDQLYTVVYIKKETIKPR